MSRYFQKINAGAYPFWQHRKPVLTMLDMEITERCNLDCQHCYINRPADDRDAAACEMSTAQICDLLQQAARLGCLMIRLTGGEPLLRGDFEDIYLCARRLGMVVAIYTNATLMTPRLADLFERIPPLHAVEVSFYGMRPESYEAATRTSGAFDAATRGLRLLSDRHIPFVLKGAVLPPTRGEIEEFETWAACLPGVTNAPIFTLFFDPAVRSVPAQKDSRIRGLRLEPAACVEILARRPDRYRREMQRSFLKNPGLRGSRLFDCGVGIDSAAVNSRGGIQPCLLLRDSELMYDLGSNSLANALGLFRTDLRRRRAFNRDYIRRCSRCFISPLCEQCPAKSWMEWGELDRPVDYYCAVAHRQAFYLGLLKKGEKSWQVDDWPERIDRFTASAALPQGCRRIDAMGH